MRKIIHISFLVILIITFASCGPHHDARISQALLFAEMQQTDSAFALLNCINQTELTDKDRAMYSLVYTMALDKSGIDVNKDSLIRIAYDWYKDKCEDTIYAKCMYYMGKYYMLNDSTEMAISCMENAKKSTQSTKDYALECLTLEKLSKLYRPTDPKQALEYARATISIYNKVHPKTISNKLFYILNLCDCLSNVDSVEKSISICTDILQLAKSEGDNMVVSDIYQDLSVFYKLTGKMKLSINSAKASYQWGYKRDNSRLLALASAYASIDSVQQAIQILRNIKSNRLQDKYTLYYIWSNAAIKIGNLSLAKHMADSAYYYMEQLYVNEAHEKINYYQLSIKKEKEKVALQAKSTKRQAIMITIIVASLCCFVALLSIFRFQKKRKDLEKEMSDKLFEEKIISQKQQLDTMRKYLMSKVDIAKRFSKNQQQSKKHILLTNEDWGELTTFLNNTDNAFVTRLTKAYSNLKETDVRLMMLLRLGVSQKDLAEIYYISEKAIKQKLYLYKSKVNIKEEKMSLRNYIEQF